MTIWRHFVLHTICGASFSDACRDSDHSHSSLPMNDVRAFFFFYSPGVNSNWHNDFFDNVFWLLFAEEKTNSRKTHHFCSTNFFNNNNNNSIKKCTHTKGASFLLG